PLPSLANSELSFIASSKRLSASPPDLTPLQTATKEQSPGRLAHTISYECGAAKHASLRQSVIDDSTILAIRPALASCGPSAKSICLLRQSSVPAAGHTTVQLLQSI